MRSFVFVMLFFVSLLAAPSVANAQEPPAAALIKVTLWQWNADGTTLVPDTFQDTCSGGPSGEPCGEIIDSDGQLRTYYLNPSTVLVKIISQLGPDYTTLDVPPMFFTSRSPASAFSRVVVVLGEYTEPSTSPPQQVFRTFTGLHQSALPLEFYGGVRRGVGQLYVKKLWRLDSGADAIGPVVADSAPTGGCIINAVNIVANTDIKVASGDIASINVTGVVGDDARITALNGDIKTAIVGGDCRGHFFAPNGKVGELTITGLLKAPESANSGLGIRAKNGIDRITAAKIESTDIVANYSGGSGNLGLLRLTGLAGTGDYAGGTTVAKNLTAIDAGTTFGVRTTGKVNAKLAFAGDATQPMVINGGIEPGATINISGSLLPNADLDDSIVLPANGLKGQVIINSRNGLPANAPAGMWTGTVVVNGTPLTNPPYYDERPVDLGGGSVGLVPYALHARDSDALNGGRDQTTGQLAIVQTKFNRSPLADQSTPFSDYDLKLSFYGPVRFESGGPGVTVFMLTPNSRPIDVTPYCVINVAPADGSGGVNRWVTVHGCPEHKFMHGKYVILASSYSGEHLLCDGVDASTPVADFEYRFDLLLDANNNGIPDAVEIAANPSLDADNDGYIDSTSHLSSCIADFNEDGFLDFTDFDAFVAAFELGDASADMNLDGFIDFTDFDDFVLYFEFDCGSPTEPCA